MVKLLTNIIVLCLLLFTILVGCSSTSDNSSKFLEKDLMDIYYKYADAIEKAELAQKYPTLYSQALSDTIKKEFHPVTNEGLGWVVYASYMPKVYIEKIHVGELSNNGEVCVTLIGKSHEKTPKYVNLLFTKDESLWKIASFNGKIFFEGSDLSFPEKAICPTDVITNIQ